MSTAAERPLVTAVVPTRNSSRTIAACLESIHQQTYPRIEVVVVDNNSGDDTAVMAQAHAAHVIVGGPERSAQRNIGARAARGAYLLFVDSDMVLESAVVAECVDAARCADAVVIPEVSFGDGFWTRCKALERSCYVGDDTIEAARFFAREAFFRAGGYDEAMSAGEDWDLHERVRAGGARSGRTCACIRHDEGLLRVRRLLAKKYYYGRELAAYRAKHPQLARSQLRLLRPSFLRHRRRLLRHPILLTGMVAMKSCEFAVGALGLAAGRLSGRSQ